MISGKAGLSMVTASQPAKRKITDPMEVWEAYWQASAESLVYEVRPCINKERAARRCRTSIQVVEMALSMNPLEVDVMAARQRKKEITRLLVEHYLSVPLNLAIEKARQTGEDFGEYFAVAEQTMRETIPRWQTGKAPFANFMNPRIKWAFHDEVHRGRWSQSVELNEEFCAPESADEVANEAIWKTVGRLPKDRKDIVRLFFGQGQSLSEIAERMARTTEWVAKQRDAAVIDLRELFGENQG